MAGFFLSVLFSLCRHVLLIHSDGTGFPESDVRGDFSDGNRRVDSRPDTVSEQGESCRADDPDVYRTDRTGDDGTCICRKGRQNDTFPFSSGRKNYDWIRGKI